MIVFDAHCDTMTEILEKKQELLQNEGHVDIRRMKQYDGFVQIFAAWMAPECNYQSLVWAMKILDKFYEQVERYQEEITLATNYDAVLQAIGEGRVAALLSIEGGEALQGDISVLRMLYRLGVRSICLTWNGRNELGVGVGEGDAQEGLTPFGIEVVKEMNRLGMLIDVSHLSPGGFWDVIAQSKKPIIASHSNAKKICAHRRNLTDEQFRAIADMGGVVGINLYPEFLNDCGKADVNDVVKHIEHFMSLGGEDHIGLGADFDGIDRTPHGIRGVQDLDVIFNTLLSLNYTQQQVEKIAGKSFLNLVRSVI